MNNLFTKIKDGLTPKPADVPEVVQELAPKWKYDDGVKRFHVKGRHGGRDLTYHQAYDALLEKATVKYDGKGMRVVHREGMQRLIDLNRVYETAVTAHINQHLRHG